MFFGSALIFLWPSVRNFNFVKKNFYCVSTSVSLQYLKMAIIIFTSPPKNNAKVFRLSRDSQQVGVCQVAIQKATEQMAMP